MVIERLSFIACKDLATAIISRKVEVMGPARFLNRDNFIRTQDDSAGAVSSSFKGLHPFGTGNRVRERKCFLSF